METDPLSPHLLCSCRPSFSVLLTIQLTLSQTNPPNNHTRAHARMHTHTHTHTQFSAAEQGWKSNDCARNEKERERDLPRKSGQRGEEWTERLIPFVSSATASFQCKVTALRPGKRERGEREREGG